MRQASAYLIPCVCGATVESFMAVTEHACPQQSFVEGPDTPNRWIPEADGPYSPLPRRTTRTLIVDGWGRV